ncbi:hypothetical protein TNCV_4878431 [Trichonephila clavipes]|nr:hypothetical protein TNCV_4878431 [Trichonephila clavipes]
MTCVPTIFEYRKSIDSSQGRTRILRLTKQKERQGAKECLEIQATKMKLLSGKSYSETSVDIVVRIPVPEVDRGRGDARPVLAVVMENTEEGFFRLGTRDG